ncbi:AIM24 family protein [Clostridium botulinum]|uniref:AIM24 family protein n=1 Tax=Clostridium TaxID=1485 RepID=UPI0002F718E7|nr:MULTISPECIES: AIM24 family protein [unclassified Clostridium]AIY78851.1 biogenesis AIM24 family protein [Clostridium botulinum 202F]KAI3345499.1 AIM24 family protein [Clostridium botulinum]KFX55167.1 transcriptional regulator [Clostridium botulinum]KFX56438.1 transcriptional regulator [Clostridium botulinum]KON11825.1 transcriptional regulator [Clostridium botulinum]
MRSSLNITNKLTMLTEMENDSKFQILEYADLNGATDLETAFGLNVINESNIKLKQIRIILDESSVKLESGLLSYMKGNIDIKSDIGGVFGLGKKFITSKLTGETMFKPVYKGSGEIFLEPSFGHFALIELEDDEIIVDDGLFCACEDGIEVGASLQRNISSTFLGNEGLCQTKISGNGIVALEIPVPETEIFKCILIDDTLKVDGNFAILRTGNIEFSVEKSSKSITGAITSGEGFVNVYRGTGEVWLIPTKAIYDEMRTKSFKEMTKPSKERNTES